MITKTEFDKLSVKEQVKYFEDLGINFIVENSAEKVLFEEKEETGEMLICFYDNERAEWAFLNTLSVYCGSFINAEYKVVNANCSYDEEARLQPIRKIYADELFDEDNSEIPLKVSNELDKKD